MGQKTQLAYAIGLAIAAMAAPAASVAAEVVAIVSSESAITKLTESQIADIFLGRISHLPDGQKVVPVDQREGSAVRDTFYQEHTGRSRAQVKAHWSRIIFTGRGRPPTEVANSEAARQRVREDPQVITYVEREFVDDSVRVVSP